MNNFVFSSKFKIFAIISAILIVAGMALGTALHFVQGTFFNYGGEYADYKSVTVSYYWVEFSGKDDVEKLCNEQFGAAGVRAYVTLDGDTATGGEIVYKFSPSTDSEKLAAAVDAINAKITEATKSEFIQSGAHMNEGESLLGGGYTLWRCAVALAAIVAAQLIYMLIRYKVAAAVTAFCADIHNFALYAAILALCRIPVDSTALIFGVLAVAATAFGWGFTSLRLKRNFKNADNAKLTATQISDKSAGQTFALNLILAGALLLSAVLIFVIAIISSMSPTAVLPLVLCAIAAFVSAGYGTAFFAPALYPKVRAIVNKIHTKKPSQKGNN